MGEAVPRPAGAVIVARAVIVTRAVIGTGGVIVIVIVIAVRVIVGAVRVIVGAVVVTVGAVVVFVSVRMRVPDPRHGTHRGTGITLRLQPSYAL
jgi:hypothetical protein